MRRKKKKKGVAFDGRRLMIINATANQKYLGMTEDKQ
jgi:hypothetical protein